MRRQAEARKPDCAKTALAVFAERLERPGGSELPVVPLAESAGIDAPPAAFEPTVPPLAGATPGASLGCFLDWAHVAWVRPPGLRGNDEFLK